MKKLLTATALAIVALSAPATAHFQLVYNPQANVEKPAQIPFKLIFWHPFENGHAMDMGEPDAFFYVFKGEKIDISDSLKPMTFKGKNNEASSPRRSPRSRRAAGRRCWPTPASGR